MRAMLLSYFSSVPSDRKPGFCVSWKNYSELLIFFMHFPAWWWHPRCWVWLLTKSLSVEWLQLAEKPFLLVSETQCLQKGVLNLPFLLLGIAVVLLGVGQWIFSVPSKPAHSADSMELCLFEMPALWWWLGREGAGGCPVPGPVSPWPWGKLQLPTAARAAPDGPRAPQAGLGLEGSCFSFSSGSELGMKKPCAAPAPSPDLSCTRKGI